MIPAFLISIEGVSAGTSEIFDAALSPKNIWIIASLCGCIRHSTNNSPSFFKPSSKSSRLIAASTHLMIWPGANWPFLALAAKACASTKTFSDPLASIIFSLRSRTLGWLEPSFAFSLANWIESSTTLSDSESTIPISKAFLAGICAPVSIILSASEGPASLGSLCVPPPPGKRPKFTSGRPTNACLEAIL